MGAEACIYHVVTRLAASCSSFTKQVYLAFTASLAVTFQIMEGAEEAVEEEKVI